MGKKAITTGTAFRPAIGDQNTEEAFRVTESRLGELEALIKPGETTPQYDDTFLKNRIRSLQRELDEHEHRRRQASGGESGDTYAGQFKVTQTDGYDLRVTMTAGVFVYGTGAVEIILQTVNISSTTGKHFLYLEASYSSGLVTAVAEDISYPLQSVTHERFALAEIDVSGGAITDVRQTQHSEIHSTRIWD